LVIGVSTPFCLAKTHRLRGTIIAYDPAYHTFKQSSFVKNLEVAIVELSSRGKKKSFIKVVFEDFGPTQVDQDVLEGTKLLDVRGVRDTKCDEAHPHLVTRFDVSTGSGSFLMNSSRATEPLPRIDSLPCFHVIRPSGEHKENGR
jgi:hypothetical protein